MFGAILKATNSFFQKCLPFCRSIHVKKIMKLLAFMFEQPSYETFSVMKNGDPKGQICLSHHHTNSK